MGMRTWHWHPPTSAFEHGRRSDVLKSMRMRRSTALGTFFLLATKSQYTLGNRGMTVWSAVVSSFLLHNIRRRWLLLKKRRERLTSLVDLVKFPFRSIPVRSVAETLRCRGGDLQTTSCGLNRLRHSSCHEVPCQHQSNSDLEPAVMMYIPRYVILMGGLMPRGRLPYGLYHAILLRSSLHTALFIKTSSHQMRWTPHANLLILIYMGVVAEPEQSIACTVG
jgi:hypothetical protein